jgi:hypothetical protein
MFYQRRHHPMGQRQAEVEQVAKKVIELTAGLPIRSFHWRRPARSECGKGDDEHRQPHEVGEMRHGHRPHIELQEVGRKNEEA